VIGPAAEWAVHRSVLAAAPYGFMLANPDGPGVSEFLGVPVPVGPLDCAAIRTNLTDGMPTGSSALPIEVKNMRDWVYPTSPELYQLLDKAAQIQALRPGIDIVPVLICRRAHIITMRMAKELGFFIILTKRQYVSPTVQESSVVELRAELGLHDLVRHADADEKIVRALVRTLPKVHDRTAEKWKATSEMFADDFGALRVEGDVAIRRAMLLNLKRNLRDMLELEFELGW
jgi:hypothetical protein